MANKFALTGYQIVNGCQTSNVLFESRDATNISRIGVSVKLVHSSTEEVINKTIKATNSQNAVKPEDLEALTEFQKRLETYYRTFQKSSIALYYERRSRQWSSTAVEKSRVITIPVQIKAFASMFLDVPHRVAGYYGTVRTNVADRIFRLEHKDLPYFVSGLAWYRLDLLFRNRSLDSTLRPWRWYLMMSLRYTVAGHEMPQLNSNKIEDYCKPLLDVLSDNAKTSSAVENIVKLISSQGIAPQSKDEFKTQSFRDRILTALSNQQ